MIKIKDLQKVSLFEELNESQLTKVSRIIKELKVPNGTDIIKDGEFGTSMYILTAGEVQIFKKLTLRIGRKEFEDKDKVLVKITAANNPIFGEMSLLTEHERSATVSAITDCVLYEIEKDDFETLCEQNPDIGYKILKIISRTLSVRLIKENSNVLKLTTALSIALR